MAATNRPPPTWRAIRARIARRPTVGQLSSFAVLKLGEASVDTNPVLKRRPKLWWSVRDPGWRADFNLRIGLPILGAALAGASALLISHF
jgi:hypothetical protein